MSVAISPCRIKKVASEIDRALQRRQRFFIFRSRPPGHPPHPISDLADVPSGAAKSAVLHRRLSSNCAPIIRSRQLVRDPYNQNCPRDKASSKRDNASISDGTAARSIIVLAHRSHGLCFIFSVNFSGARGWYLGGSFSVIAWRVALYLGVVR